MEDLSPEEIAKLLKKKYIDLSEKNIVWEWYERGRYYQWGETQSKAIEKAYKVFQTDKRKNTIEQTASNGQKYRVNFTRMTQENTYSYYTRTLRRREETKVTKKSNIQDLKKIWKKYYDEEEDGMSGEKIMEFCENLSINPMEINLLVYFFKLGADKKYFLSEAQFIIGNARLGFETESKIKSGVKKIKKEIQEDKEFQDFYMWLFDYFREPDARVIPIETAIPTWELVFNFRKYKFISNWCEYYKKNKHAVTKDTWKMFFNFTKDKTFKTTQDFANYDLDMSVYPSSIDEFIEFMAKK